jgi:hypothetical protein
VLRSCGALFFSADHALRVHIAAFIFRIFPALDVIQSEAKDLSSSVTTHCRGDRSYQICPRNHRYVDRPNCTTNGDDLPEILAVPVMPSVSDPSGFGKSISTAM